MRSGKRSTTALLLLLLAGCATAPKAPPTYTAASSGAPLRYEVISRTVWDCYWSGQKQAYEIADADAQSFRDMAGVNTGAPGAVGGFGTGVGLHKTMRIREDMIRACLLGHDIETDRIISDQEMQGYPESWDSIEAP